MAAWALTAAAFPWAVLYYRADSGFGPITGTEVVHGYDGVLGPPSVILYALCLVLGVVIGLRRGVAWVSIVSLTVSALLLVFLFLKSAAIQLSADLASGDSTREPAFWVALVTTAFLLVMSLLALASRRPTE